MNTSNEKTTIYLHPSVKRGVQIYALRDKRSLSDIINEKLVEYLEDMADLAEIKKRESEPTVAFETAIKELGLNLHEIRRQTESKRPKRTGRTGSTDR